MSEIRIKRGASLNLTFRFLRERAPWDVGHVTLSAQVRAPDDTFVAQLQLIKQATLGLVTASVFDTGDWPIGTLRCDLRAVVAGHTLYSETFAIVVAKSVTQS